MTDKTLAERLAAPTPQEEIKWRQGPGGRNLAYVDARYVMDVLDRECGPDGWQCKYDWSDGKRLVCSIGIRFDGQWIWKANGAGETDIEGEKGAFSDAFKRAAVLFGIGRDLYHLQDRKAVGSPNAPSPTPTPVRTPVRASEGNVAQGQTGKADPPAAVYQISEVKQIEYVSKKTGKQGYRWEVLTRDGKVFKTFDRKKAEDATNAIEFNLPVKIAYSVGQWGNDITALLVIEEHPEQPPAPPSPEVIEVVDLFGDAEVETPRKKPAKR